MKGYVYVVEVTSDAGNTIVVYRTKRGAERYVARVNREAREADDDFDTRAISWPSTIREEGDDPE